ncbi:MAG: Dps family protein [Bacillaceae bacterium]
MKNRAVMTGLDEAYAKKLTKLLNTYLANLHVVYIKINNFHWNVVGVDFVDFHKLLEKLYKKVGKEIDYVAERIKQVGHYPLASMSDMLKHATLKEAPSTDYNTATIAYALAEDFAETAKYLRMVSTQIRDSTDENTINHLGVALEFLEKYVWFFTAYLERMKEN